MDELYYQVGGPASFGGVEKLRRKAGTSRKKVLEFLEQSDVYTKYKPARRHFLRRKTIAYQKFELIQADLADFQKLSRFNKGFKYVLVAIDVLSKFVFYIPVKSKTCAAVHQGFKKIFSVATPKLLQTDQGGEFTSAKMQQYFKRKHVHWYHTFSESKATLAERQIRTLRESLIRIFSHTGSKKYIHLLPKLANAYNNTPHSRTGLAPIKVNEKNQTQVFEKLFGGPRRSSSKPKFSPGDQVRVSFVKGIFTKGSYEQNFTDEVFTIKRIKFSDPLMYYVEDIDQTEILGGFYEKELTRVKKNDQDLWDVEKVIKSRTCKDGVKQYLVKWRGYDSKHNSWVTDLQRK
jgi:hypothetical protein